MHSIWTDVKKNRIYIKLGAIDTGEGARIMAEIEAAISRLTPGFSAISDILNFSYNDPGEGAWAEKAIKRLVDGGLARSIRVIGREVPYHETEEELGYRVGSAKSIEAADALLDSLSDKS